MKKKEICYTQGPKRKLPACHAGDHTGGELWEWAQRSR